MTDIVDRLLALAREFHQHRPHYEEAAAEIERLRAMADARGETIAKLTTEREQLRTTTDIVERLRATAPPDIPEAEDVMLEAGAEIERLIEALQDCQSRAMTARMEQQAEIERLRADMTEIRKVLAHVAGDIRAVFHERPDLYKAIIRVDTIALDPE